MLFQLQNLSLEAHYKEGKQMYLADTLSWGTLPKVQHCMCTDHGDSLRWPCIITCNSSWETTLVSTCISRRSHPMWTSKDHSARLTTALILMSLKPCMPTTTSEMNLRSRNNCLSWNAHREHGSPCSGPARQQKWKGTSPSVMHAWHTIQHPRMRHMSSHHAHGWKLALTSVTYMAKHL